MLLPPLPPPPALERVLERACTLRRPDGAAIAFRVAPALEEPGAVPLLLHGLASNLTRWSEFVERCALRERHDLVRVDLRGHGDLQARGAIARSVIDMRRPVPVTRRRAGRSDSRSGPTTWPRCWTERAIGRRSWSATAWARNWRCISRSGIRGAPACS